MAGVGISPDRPREILADALARFGFGEDYLKDHVAASDLAALKHYARRHIPQGEGAPRGKPVTVDLLAFVDGHEHNWRTAAVAADLQAVGLRRRNDSAKAAKRLYELTGAPTAVLAAPGGDSLDIWFNCHLAQMVGPVQAPLTTRGLIDVLESHRHQVDRESLSMLRQGQQHLFDKYLYARRDDLVSYLHRGVSNALEGMGTTLTASTDEPREKRLHTAFIRVALALLAARILEDKGALTGADESGDARHILSVASQRWDAFFQEALEKDLSQLEERLVAGQLEDALRCVLAHLTGPVNFGLVTHEMLGDLYEQALLDQRLPEEEGTARAPSAGIHYTPLSIARRLLAAVPLEKLPPSERTVCDFACGSGSFVLAATEALTSVYDERERGSGPSLSQYLKASVLGNDTDPVAALIAKLSYLITYVSKGVTDEHQVPYPCFKEADATRLDFLSTFGKVPSVIASNPPFDAEQPATAFLTHAVKVLAAKKSGNPRYLCMIMPQLFLTGGQQHAEARRQLLAVGRLLEVWEMPEHTVGLHSDHATCAIIAQIGSRAGQQSSAILRVQALRSRRRKAVEAFRDRGVPTWSFLSSHPARDGAQFAFSPVDRVWDGLAKTCPRADAFVQADWGFHHTREGDKVARFRDTPAPGYVPFFRHQSALRPFIVQDADWKESHGKKQSAYWKKGTGPSPKDQCWPKYDSPKIFVTARRNRNARAQLVAAVDTLGIYPAKDFIVLTLQGGWRAQVERIYGPGVPNMPDEEVLLWLCGILNSPLGQAWFAKHGGPRGISGAACSALPLPRGFDPRIGKAVREAASGPGRPLRQGWAAWEACTGCGPSSNLHLRPYPLTAGERMYWAAVAKVNGLVMACYSLAEPEKSDILSYLRATLDPTAAHEYGVGEVPAGATLRILHGQVHRFDLSRQIVRLRFGTRALGGGKTIEMPVPKFMPGWATRARTRFTCRAPSTTDLAMLRNDPWLLRDFRPVPYAYLTGADLERLVGYERPDKREA